MAGHQSNQNLIRVFRSLSRSQPTHLYKEKKKKNQGNKKKKKREKKDLIWDLTEFIQELLMGFMTKSELFSTFIQFSPSGESKCI